MQIVRFKTRLSHEELMSIAREREPQFRAIPGILQKYYIQLSDDGEYGGVYIWDSAESLRELRGSALAASIPKAYQAIEPPSVEIVDILFKLRS